MHIMGHSAMHLAGVAAASSKQRWQLLLINTACNMAHSVFHRGGSQLQFIFLWHPWLHYEHMNGL